jgi:hypothetical protein
MRTTLDIDEDVMLAAKALARRQKRTAGAVISELARKGLAEAVGEPGSSLKDEHGFYGFKPLPSGGRSVTDEAIDALREEMGD